MTSRVRNELYSYKNQPIYELYLGQLFCKLSIQKCGKIFFMSEGVKKRKNESF